MIRTGQWLSRLRRKSAAERARHHGCGTAANARGARAGVPEGFPPARRPVGRGGGGADPRRPVTLMPEEAIDWVLGRLGADAFTPELRAAQVELVTAPASSGRPRSRRARRRAGRGSSTRSAVVSASSPPAAIRPLRTRSAVTNRPRYLGNRERVLVGDAPGLAVRGARSRRARRPGRGARRLQRGAVVPARACRARRQLALLRGGRQRSRLEPAEADGGPAALGHPAGVRFLARARGVRRLGHARGGLFPDLTYLWWDLRPRPELGTLEFRIADVQTSPEMCGRASPPSARPSSPHSRSVCGQESSCPCSRRTCLPRIVGARCETASRRSSPIPRRGFPRPPATGSRRLLGELESHAQRLGSERELAHAWRLLARNGADRQREVAAERRRAGTARMARRLHRGPRWKCRADPSVGRRAARRRRAPSLTGRRPLARIGVRGHLHELGAGVNGERRGREAGTARNVDRGIPCRNRRRERCACREKRYDVLLNTAPPVPTPQPARPAWKCRAGLPASAAHRRRSH